MNLIDQIEQKLAHEPFEVVRIRGARFSGDLPKRITLRWSDGIFMMVKWKRSAKGGWAENNQPRYEIAAYQLQKLFLDPEEYVVPPTVARCLPLVQYSKVEKDVDPTFKNTNSVLFVLQYWLDKVTQKNVFDKKRLRSDSTYAKHLANMNILSYLIKHKDANIGNFLISSDPANPRVFAVDNGLAFTSAESNRGTDWQKIRVKNLPRKTVEKLKEIEKSDLENSLGIVAQFRIENHLLLPMDAGDNLNEKKGVRRTENIVQFGLTKYEINLVHNRLKKLIKKIDSGKIRTF